MNTSIRDKSRRRRLLLACVTALGAFVVVYFANAAYHELLLDKLGLSQALVDALGAAAAVLVSFLAQEALSIARHRDATYGAENAPHRAREEAGKRREAATAVSESLAQVPHLNLKQAFAKARQLQRPVGLHSALQLAGMQFQGQQHRALEDARNTARLLPLVLPLKD